eukprot:CAMPEP_0174832526 /NCGR_PEP_ID=MMETSP1114-20130205/3719_1 /TAXON_ID=312471 /ORGANISM="Neobodo designis, Strain CCAP 1951/1" /LENGTH=506 /DNA_ID=CAMNT_0016066385 /DNA_START=52 /DNA_END=1572 /DNA_ORIENTATION=-
MTSREEFMRSLGISESDMAKPPPEDTSKARRKPPMAAPAASAMREPESPVRSMPSYTSAPAPQPATTGSGGAGSRAEFLRSLGIDNAEDKFATQIPGGAAASAPAPAPVPQRASAGSSGAGSRADFLRSLGIDNADDKFASQIPAGGAAASGSAAAASPTPARNATGSQELPRPYGRPAPSSGAPQPRAYTRNYAEEDAADAPTTTTPQKMPSDWTLGPKAAAHRAPETPALDAELKGMKDTAGAEEVKAMGNKFFQAGDYRKAVRLYTRAIELDPQHAALYSNRSAAYLLGGKQMGIDTRSMALRDADKTIKLKPTWFKGFSRRGDALFKLERYPEAAEAYESALELDPGNSAIIHSLNEVRPFASKAKRDVSGTWSAPGSGNLHASVASLSGTKTTDKSAFELLDELDQQRQRTTPHLARGGDYKSKQLEEFRKRRTGDSQNTTEESPAYQPTYDTQESTTASATRERPTVTTEFSSDAAREYQQQLLESYRKKKQQAATGRRY